MNEVVIDDAVQARHSGTCLKGNFLAIDLDFLCNCHNHNTAMHSSQEAPDRSR